MISNTGFEPLTYGKVIKRKIPRDGAIVVESFQSKTDHTKNIRIVVFATKIVVYILEGCNVGRLVQRISDVTRSKILRNCCFKNMLYAEDIEKLIFLQNNL